MLSVLILTLLFLTRLGWAATVARPATASSKESFLAKLSPALFFLLDLML